MKQLYHALITLGVLFVVSLPVKAEKIRLIKEGNLFTLPVTINNVINVHFILDTGANEVVIPADVASTLWRTRTIREEHLLPEVTVTLADGSQVKGQRVILESLQLGSRTIRQVPAIVGNYNGLLLLGQNFLERLGSWSIVVDRRGPVLLLGSSREFLNAPEFQPPIVSDAPNLVAALDLLKRVPVFVVASQDNKPVVASMPDPENEAKTLKMVTFFMDYHNAQSLLDTLRVWKPELAKNAKIHSTSLRDAYEVTIKNKDKKDQLVYRFLPDSQQIDSAIALLNQSSGQQVEKFDGIPVFYAAVDDSAVDDSTERVLTVKKGENEIIPFFLSEQDLQQLLAQLKQKDPELASTTQMKVTSLNHLWSILLQEKGLAIQQITLVPAREELQYVIEQERKSL